nr:MAG TPA: hypothetical protein [Caudoviricetes sp.]
MALDAKKITSYTDNVKSLSDYPSDDGITAAQLKAIFDGRTDKEVKSAINGIIDELTATTGAAQLGTADGGSVQTALDSKVGAQAGKGLSTNDYTTAEKQKLSGIAAGATKTIVDAALSATSENPVQNKAVQTALNAKANVANPEFAGSVKVKSATAGVLPITITPTSAGAILRYGDFESSYGLNIASNGLYVNQDGDNYKIYAENNKPPVDAALSATSENPVQNKAVKVALDAKANAANPQFSGTATINTSGAGELRVRNSAGDRNFVEVSVTPGDADAPLELKLKRGNTAETFDTGKIYTSYDPQPADSALSATSTNPVQNKVVNAAINDLGIKYGTYTGNGSEYKTITLSRKPNWVFVLQKGCRAAEYNNNQEIYYGGLALQSAPVMAGSEKVLEITSTGFTVYNAGAASASVQVKANENQQTYTYLWG